MPRKLDGESSRPLICNTVEWALQSYATLKKWLVYRSSCTRFDASQNGTGFQPSTVLFHDKLPADFCCC